MPTGVVDLLQAVDVNERHHQIFGSTTRSIHLPLKLLHPGATPSDLGQLVRLGRFSIQRSLGTVARCKGAVARGLRTFLGRPVTIFRCPGAIIRGPGSVIGRLLTIERSSVSTLSSPHPHRLDLIAPRSGAGVPHLSYLIPRGCHLRTFVRGDVAGNRDSQTSAGLLIAESGRMLAVRSCQVTSLLIPRCGFAITCHLILL